MTLLERLDERWERMDGAAARKIDRILKERREAAGEIRRLRGLLLRLYSFNEPGTCHCGACPVDELGFCATCEEEITANRSKATTTQDF